MSEPNGISQLLDGLVVGEPISEHHGIRCCPAMAQDSDDKYIIKILSVPASQVQLDALLLTGAYKDQESALAYFKELSDGVVQEAEILQELSNLEGFVGYDSWHVKAKEDGTGYDVFLLGAYRPTLERYCARNAMTHSQAVNLGLDMCAALSVCRQSGYLYAALKPDNIYIGENGEFRIGDLGFIPMDSLKYASLPDKYRSAYTAPEIEDAYSAINETIDVYALGVILHQVYNGGELPADPTTAPVYADEEMAAIILKACAADPNDRWQNPAELGQALVGYLHNNSVDGTPIVPPVAEETEEVPEIVEISEESQETAEVIAAVDSAMGDDAEQVQEQPEATESTEAEAAEDNEQPAEDVDEMLAQADDLIAHETPDPVVAPDPIDVPIPPKIVPESDAPEDETVTEEAKEEAADETTDDAAVEETVAETSAEETAAEEAPTEESSTEETPAEETAEKQPKKYTGLIAILTTVLVLLLLAVGAIFYYEYFYIQSLHDLSLDGAEDYLTVKLDTEIDNSLLTVYCSDTYGNTKQASVVNNTAYFTQLSPDTQYKVSVEISGFRKLIGTTSDTYTTDPCANITSFTAVTGPEDGSVILNFVVQGQKDTPWRVVYRAAGEEEKTLDFTGNMVTVTGLTVGAKYSFRLETASTLYVTGTDTLEYTASKVITAENLTVKGFDGNTLNVLWNAPEGVTVGSWTVRCYNDAGYDNTVTVTDMQAAFTVTDPAAAYTVDIKAEGMSMSVHEGITANSATVKEIKFDDSAAGKLTVSWTYEGTAPEGGWLLLYTVDGSEPQVVRSETATATLPKLIPGGSYTFTLQAAAGTSVFCESASFKAAGGTAFSGYRVTADKVTFKLCRTPNKKNWTRKDLKNTDYTTEFAVGEKGSMLVKLETKYSGSKDNITTLFVIRDANKNPISIESNTRTWNAMWNQGYCSMNIPVMPDAAGVYTLDIYFNNAFVKTVSFTIK